ncbi:MAG: ACT domain-containing protein [Deferribacteraceae bacterium]|jgi:hypothetical protein|nr:ACT domain-containing protein [Deferribacteraceae bacterium]
MKVRQISIFIENELGRLYEVTRLLGDNSLNIRALSLADTSDFGIIRLIVNDPVKAHDILKAASFTVGINEVVAVAIPDVPGGLADVLGYIGDNKINIEYMYAFVDDSGKDAVMVFRFDDVDNALAVLTKSPYKVLNEEKVFNI